jgi:hypothetical protein
MFWQPEMSVKPKATFVYRDIYFDDFKNLVDKYIVVTKWGNFLILLYKFIIHSKIARSQMSAIILRILLFTGVSFDTLCLFFYTHSFTNIYC